MARRAPAMLLTLALTLGSGAIACKAQESEPVAVARAFAETARRGDVEGMLAVVERPAVARLRDAAETASDQVGGRRAIEPHEMLQIVGVDRTTAVAAAELINDDGRTAQVELTMTDGRSVRLELVWEQGDAAADAADSSAGAWKVRVPLPTTNKPPPELGPRRPDA